MARRGLSAAGLSAFDLLHPATDAEEVVESRDDGHEDRQVEQRRDPQRRPVHRDDGEDRGNLKAGLDLAEQFTMLDDAELEDFKPKLVFVDAANRITEVKTQELSGPTY